MADAEGKLMAACPTIRPDGSTGIAPALRALDCAASETVGSGFARLFGADGRLETALGILLTIYVGLYALQLLTGRSRLGLPALSGRVLTLGVVLTFATSWTAYQTVALNLLSAGPDALARILLGTTGSATELFAGRLDSLFRLINLSAQQSAAAAQMPGAAVGGLVTRPADILWFASLVMMLGTVGVLVVTRIALAVTLALGPVFIVAALFRPTRGLFDGWLRVAVQLALAPLLAVLFGTALLKLIQPLLAGLVASDGRISLTQATMLLTASFVHMALMVFALRAAGSLSGALRTGPAAAVWQDSTTPGSRASAYGFRPETAMRPGSPMVLETPGADNSPAGRGENPVRDQRAYQLTKLLPATAESGPAAMSSAASDPRLRPLGQRFRPAREAR